MELPLLLSLQTTIWSPYGSKTKGRGKALGRLKYPRDSWKAWTAVYCGCDSGYMNAMLTKHYTKLWLNQQTVGRGVRTLLIRWFPQLCGERHIARLELRGKAFSILVRVLDEFSTTSNLKLDGKHIHPGLGCWSFLHLSVNLTQEKPLRQLLSLKTLLQVSPIGEEPIDTFYLCWTGVCQAVVGGHEWVSSGP